MKLLRRLPALASLLCLFLGMTADDSPATVVESFYRAANQGHCSEARQLFTDDALAVIDATLGDAGGFDHFCAEKGGRAPLERTLVKRQRAAVLEAEVVLERHYKNGDLSIETDGLVKQGGVWKITFPAPTSK